MNYVVQYNSSSGSPGDNRIIGVYSTKELAESAKSSYIEHEIGVKPTQEELDIGGYTMDEWEYDFNRLDECIWIHRVINMY
jgi:hypothetical protein